MLFLLWVLLLTFSSFSLVNRFFRQDEPAEKLLHLLVIFYGLLLVSFTLLGCFHWLKPLWITLSFFVFSLLSGLTGRLSLKKNDGPALRLVGQIAIAFTVCVFLMVVDFQSFLPPLTTDGLLYHLPFAAHYLQTASLSYPPLFFHDIAMTYYPHGGDLLYAFSLFSQNEHLLRFTQLPMVVIASLALYQLMKNQGFSRETSILGACLFSLVRPVAGQTFSCFVDLMLTAWFFSVVYYFSTGQGRKVCLGLVAAGLLISTKNFA
ncbi:MAG TPA: hypothetical protein PKX93_11895, partial [bacterium]|nr:hypothetical protein [bacterium]